MILPDVAEHSATAALSMDLRINVVLIGLQPVYAHGLLVGLTATGLCCTVLPAGGALTQPPEPAGPVVAVLPSGERPDVALDDAMSLTAVHVLAEASAQAYSDALRAGATGAFAFDAELADIARIVLYAGLGLTLLPVDVARALNRRSVGPRPPLTSRDLQYLRLLAGGATVASMGRRFAHSEREMYRLLTATYQRLGASNRTQALLLAQRLGLLDEHG